MEKLNTSFDSKSNKYAESVTLRNEVVETCNVDFLDKIKAVEYLNEDMILTVDQVANYYETSRDSISTIIKRNRDEFENDGMVVLTGQELKDFKKSLEGSFELSKVNKSLILLKHKTRNLTGFRQWVVH